MHIIKSTRPRDASSIFFTTSSRHKPSMVIKFISCCDRIANFQHNFLLESNTSPATMSSNGFDTFIVIFLSLNVLFLVGTAVWFRLDHATKRNRFINEMQETLVDEVMWQYSLRSNILLFACVMAFYLIYIGEAYFLLGLFAAFSIVNVITDATYRYDGAAIFHKVVKGHQIAAIIICTITIIYAIVVTKRE